MKQLCDMYFKGFNVTFKLKHRSSSLFSHHHHSLALSASRATAHMFAHCHTLCHIIALHQPWPPLHQTQACQTPLSSLGMLPPTLLTASSASSLCHWPLLAAWLCRLILLPMSPPLPWRQAHHKPSTIQHLTPLSPLPWLRDVGAMVSLSAHSMCGSNSSNIQYSFNTPYSRFTEHAMSLTHLAPTPILFPTGDDNNFTPEDLPNKWHPIL